MSLDEIAAILQTRTESSDRRDIVTERTAATERQLERLQAAREHLGHLLSCPRNDPVANCPVLRRRVAAESAAF